MNELYPDVAAAPNLHAQVTARGIRCALFLYDWVPQMTGQKIHAAMIERELDAAVVKHSGSWSNAYGMEDILSNRSRNLGEKAKQSIGPCECVLCSRDRFCKRVELYYRMATIASC